MVLSGIGSMGTNRDGKSTKGSVARKVEDLEKLSAAGRKSSIQN